MYSGARVVVPALFGALLALSLAADVHQSVGPFDTTMSARPGWSGETLVRLAPLGTVRLDTHDAPLAVEVRIEELRLEEAEAIARDPSVLRQFEDRLAGDVRRGLLRLALRSLIVGTLGGLLGVLVLRRAVPVLALGALVGAGLVVSVGAASAATWHPEAVNEPRYTGLLTVAPKAVGDAEAVIARFGEYRARLADFVGNVVALYRVAEGLPSFDPARATVRVLHVSDVHLNPQAFDVMRQLVDGFDVDAVVDTGDMTDWGTEPETQLMGRIAELGVPYAWVRGNHDSPATQAAVAAQPNAVVLDGRPALVAGLRMWGVGDPRYTPDKSEEVGTDEQARVAAAFADEVARRLRAEVAPIDVVAVHDPRVVRESAGLAPLFLAGHTHNARRSRLGADSVLLVQGSTGGAGLRALEGDEPEPLTCSVLYFDAASRRLLAVDQVTVEGLGRSGVRIQRHVVRP